MATWAVEIEVLNLADKRLRVTATRTDGADIRTYTAEATVDTGDLPGSRDRVVNALWDAHATVVATETAQNALLVGWEAAVATALNVKETP
jgi:hypothetical protein